MMYFKVLLALQSFMFISNKCFNQDVLNLNLISNEIRDDLRYSGSWTYVDALNNEYALLGAASGTAVYSILPSGQTSELAFIPGPVSNWREITVLGDYAYVTTEGTDSIPTGLQVIDLSELPSSASLIQNFNSTFTRGHIIQRDIYSEIPYIYVMGTSSTEGVHIIDVSDPFNPQEVGLYAPGYYIHDAHVNGDLLFAAAFFESKVDVVDISDKTSPALITEIFDPGGNTHSSWLTEDKSHLILADERDELPGRIFNIVDLTEVKEVATFTSNDSSLVHNPYVRGDFAFVSHNTEGLRVYDIKDPTLPVEVGFYDTFDGPSGGFSGLWSACPYLPSGRIIGGDRTRGLFVWEFEETRAARIYGQVIDSISGAAILNAEIIIQLDTLFSENNGNFKYGVYPQSISINASAQGYETKVINLNLAENQDEDLVIKLNPIESSQENLGQLNPVIVYPNPAVDFVAISIPNIYDVEKIFIYNSLGELIEQRLDLTSKMKINISNFSPGNYFVHFVSKVGDHSAIGSFSVVN